MALVGPKARESGARELSKLIDGVECSAVVLAAPKADSSCACVFDVHSLGQPSSRGLHAENATSVRHETVVCPRRC